jgi:CubicO group peptidase (beta-lactamase class C family)
VQALQQVASWPVPHAGVAVVARDGTVLGCTGAADRSFRLASLTKPLVAWAVLIATEEGIVRLDDAIGQPGCTLRHLLAHAGGYAFTGADPVAEPGRRRIYSNTGFDLAAAEVARRAGMPFGEYLDEAVLAPLGMQRTALRGPAAHGAHSTVADMVAFLCEIQQPALLATETVAEIFRTQYPELAGIVPGVGRFDPCPWGLGFEIRGGKSPHWTGRTNAPATVGHFGGAGTMMWVDPAVGCGLVALTDRPFDQWSIEAMKRWPELSDAVVAEVGEVAGLAGGRPD